MNLEDEQRLKAHKRRLESGELDGPCNQRKRKRLMMKIAKLKKKCAADNLSTSAPKKNKLNRKQRKVKTLHLNKELKELAQRKQLKRAQNAFRKGESLGIVDKHSYTNMINAYIRCGKNDMGKLLLDQMVKRGIEPSVVTYTVLLKGACESGTLQLAKNILCDMERSSVAHNLRSCNTYLRGCVRAGAVAEGIQFFKSMTMDPDFTTYEYLVSLLCRALHVNDAAEIIKTLENETSTDNVSLDIWLARTYAMLRERAKSQHFLIRAQNKIDKNSMLDQQIQHRRERTSREREKHDLSRARSIAQFANHRQEELRLKLHQLEQVHQYWSNSSPSLSHYFRNVIVIGDMAQAADDHIAKTGNESTGSNSTGAKHLRTNFSIANLEDRYGCAGGRENKTLHRSTVEKFDDSGKLNLPGQSIKLEIGAGTGEWARSQAKRDKSSTWVTLELRSDRVYETFCGIALNHQNNVIAIEGEANNVVENCMPSQTIDWIFINHPEPPERTGGESDSNGAHLLTCDFFRQLLRVLKPEGKLTVMTDNLRYGRSLVENISKNSFVDVLRTNDHHELVKLGSTSQQHGEIVQLNPNALEKQESTGFVTLYEGNPGEKAGHTVDASSQFGRLWDTGSKVRRFYMCVTPGEQRS